MRDHQRRHRGRPLLSCLPEGTSSEIGRFVCKLFTDEGSTPFDDSTTDLQMVRAEGNRPRSFRASLPSTLKSSLQGHVSLHRNAANCPACAGESATLLFFVFASAACAETTLWSDNLSQAPPPLVRSLGLEPNTPRDQPETLRCRTRSALRG